MKKTIILILSILFITFLTIYLVYIFLLVPEEIVTDPGQQQQLVEATNLDYLLNLGQYPDKENDNSRLLEVGMRLAKKYNLMHEEVSPEYFEYVKREDLHIILKELTGKEFKDPIIIEDFYYQYDNEKDIYFVIPTGADWQLLGSITSIVKRKDIYTIKCNINFVDEDSNAYEEPATVKVKYVEENDIIKFKVLEVKTTTPPIANAPKVDYTTYVYGESEKGRDLVSHVFTPSDYNKTILLNFEIHGYEDAYDKDGQVLVDTANSVIEYYKAHLDLLEKTRLIIIPSSNPDGLLEGTTNNGFGRCNANGVDLNRDFDASYVVNETPRNKTLEPFSAQESRALRDLVLQENPTIVIDFHGWLNYTIGDAELAKIFSDKLNLSHKTEFNDNCNGYFSYWASLEGVKALLVEFENDKIPTDKLIDSINEINNSFQTVISYE
jgi:hypothetical protein